jgi:hypothetical protein
MQYLRINLTPSFTRLPHIEDDVIAEFSSISLNTPSCLFESMCYVVFNEDSQYVGIHTSERPIQEGTTHMKCSRGMVQSNRVTID